MQLFCVHSEDVQKVSKWRKFAVLSRLGSDQQGGPLGYSTRQSLRKNAKTTGSANEPISRAPASACDAARNKRLCVLCLPAAMCRGKNLKVVSMLKIIYDLQFERRRQTVVLNTSFEI